jgi:tetratricopeptide (TPR) repeat protein
MDCRVSIFVALSVTLAGGCVATPTSQNSSSPAELPAHVNIQKAPDGPKRPPLPGTVVSLAIIKEREAQKSQDAAQQMKLYDDARLYYQEALKIDSKYRDALLGLARVYVRMDDYPHALDIYQKSLEKTPKDHALWFDLGKCYCHKKELPQAVPCFQKALELDPENRAYMKTLGFTLARIGQTDQGLDLLTRAMGKALAHYNLAGLMDYMGDRDQSRRHLQVALQLNPNLEQARDMLDAFDPPRATLQFSTE